jgi:hypothetical protein
MDSFKTITLNLYYLRKIPLKRTEIICNPNQEI